MKRLLAAAVCLGTLLMGGTAPVLAQDAGEKITRTWAMAEFGEPLYGPDMRHWPYANPDAPKGGSVVLGAFGSFDSLNTYILRGSWPTGIGLISDSLMTGSGDELSSAYGLIAETAEYPEDKSWIIFNLRPEARWHDGHPITADDFKFAFDTIKEHGRPFLQSFYEDVSGVEVLDPRRLKFTFKTRDSMKPLLTVASSSPLPRHWWTAEGRDITKTTLEPILGSGAYRIKAIDAGRSITYERVADYWAADLPVNRGLNNIDQIRYDYYLDDTVLAEAFMSGRIDFRQENRAQRWNQSYDVPAVKDGSMIKRVVPDQTPRGTQGYIFNLRRPQFQDVRVREAITLLYDFEAIQRTLLFGEYKRVKSWFPNSEFGASGPPDPKELSILEKYRDKVRPEVLTKAYEPPVTDGSGNIRANLRESLRLFREAGWELKNNRLVNAAGEQMRIEILLVSPALVRLTEPFVQNARRAGIDASIRVVDTSQYQVRIDDFDYDLLSVALNFFPPPGAEQRSYFGSVAAGTRGSGNLAGIKDPVVDGLIEELIAARDLDTLAATNRALDRVLSWGWYQIPQWYNDESWLVYWNKFGYPETMAKYTIGFPTTWWVDTGKQASVRSPG
ncbi:extracellular solute-binding protein [Skermanella mucosa]|uniref:extracellular solute-binding protein n=1 Tax=Skermanella mucosa TaxID=1789672 RepID=UPI00192B2F6F|nr:extracellular solute-binding protein [Skermanella mucosa]UEM20282.1 extracellular solute-binding protein [Skermanella mucosa]